MAVASSSWKQAMVQISPYTFSAIGIAISIGVSVLGAAWGIYITESSLIGASIKAPRITSKNIISLGPYLSALSSIQALISAKTRAASSSGSPCISEWYNPSYSFSDLSSLLALSYNIFDPDGQVTPSAVPCTVRNGAVTLWKLFWTYSVCREISLMVPILGFPVYLLGFAAMIFSFSVSLIAFTTILLSGIKAHVSASPNNSPYDKQWGGEDEPSPCIGLGLEIHKHGDQPAHGFPEQESRQMLVVIATPHALEEVHGGGRYLVHLAQVASDAVGAAVAEEIGDEDGVAPGSVVNTYLLEAPSGVGSVAVGHENRALDRLALLQRQKRLREESAVRGVEIRLRIAHPPSFINPSSHISQNTSRVLIGLTLYREWYNPSYSFSDLSSLLALSYNIFDPDGQVTPSAVPCTVRNGAVTLLEVVLDVLRLPGDLLMVPILGFPVYLLGFAAMIFSFSVSLIAFTTILLSGIKAHVSASPNNSPYDKQWGGEDEPSPCIGLGLEIHKHGDQPAHGFPEQESRQMLVVIATPHALEEVHGGGRYLVHLAQVASDAVGAAVAEEIGDEDGVAPGSVVNTYLLEAPSGVGSVAVGHENRALDRLALLQRQKRLREESAVRGVEIRLRIAHPP
nr:V-type proton ATPase subunit C''1 [Ipomoea batatas]